MWLSWTHHLLYSHTVLLAAQGDTLPMRHNHLFDNRLRHGVNLCNKPWGPLTGLGLCDTNTPEKLQN